MNCKFIHKNNFNHKINAIIHFRGNYNISSYNIFINNEVFTSIDTVLFDGMMTVNNNNDKIIKFKFLFNNNCISPFDEKVFISGNIQINDEKDRKNHTLYSAFEFECDDYITTKTEHINSPTESFTIQIEPVFTFSDKISTIFETTIIDSISVQNSEKQNNNSKNDISQYQKIFIIQTSIISFLTVLVLVILILLIYFIKKTQNQSHTSLNTSFIEMT